MCERDVHMCAQCLCERGYTCMCASVCARRYIHVCTCVCEREDVHMCVHVCVYVCVYACVPTWRPKEGVRCLLPLSWSIPLPPGAPIVSANLEGPNPQASFCLLPELSSEQGIWLVLWCWDVNSGLHDCLPSTLNHWAILPTPREGIIENMVGLFLTVEVRKQTDMQLRVRGPSQACFLRLLATWFKRQWHIS